MKKKGFTLVELLGVIVLLVIILGIVVIGYIKITEGTKKTYYKGQEKSILLAAGEYYNYNKAKEPKMFGQPTLVNLGELISGGYIENVVDRNKQTCDLANSKVIAYKDAYEEIKYEVCLKCPGDEYESESVCNKSMDDYGYDMKVVATIGTSKTEYREGTWTNQNVTLTFKTELGLKGVKVTGENIKNSEAEKYNGECTFSNNNGEKSCNLVVNKEGEYKYTIKGYTNEGEEQVEKTIEIKIDTVKPTFVINKPTGPNINIAVENGNEKEIDYGNDTVSTVVIENIIKDIRDAGSGINGIIYSIEKNERENKTGTIENEQIKIAKELGRGKWTLTIEARDNAGNKTVETMVYKLYQRVTRPNNQYCKSGVIYTGNNQTYTKEAPTGVYFENVSGINAGSYTVTSKLKEYYVWNTGERKNTETFECSIGKKDTTINWGTTTLTYNGENQAPSVSATGVEGETINISRTMAIDVGNYTSTASCVSVAGGQKSCDNYNFTNTTKNYTINKKNVTVNWGGTEFIYNGGSQAPTASVNTGIAKESMTVSRTTEINVGSYTSTASCVSVAGGQGKCSNYNLKNTTNQYTINKKNVTVNWGGTEFTYNGNKQGPTASVTTGVTGETMSVDRTTEINAGNYTSTASCTSVTGGQGKCSNYNLTSTTKQFTINKKEVSVNWGGTEFTYNGNKQGPTASVTTGVTGETMSVDRTTEINAGNYTSTASCTSVTGGQKLCNNYKLTNNTKGYIIKRASLGNPPESPADKTYNGSDQNSGITCPSGSTTNGDTKKKDAGTYSQKCTPDSNHQWGDGTTNEKSISWKINRANSTCTITNTPTLKYPRDTTGTLSFTCTGDGTITVTSDNTNIVTVSESGNSRTLTSKDIGTIKIVVNQAQGKNYNATSVSTNITVTGSDYTLAFNGNGGTTPNSKTYIYGDKLTNLPTSSRDYYNFSGWYTAASGGVGPASNNWQVDSSWIGLPNNTNTYYAHWSPKTATITYYCNGGTGGNSQTFTVGVANQKFAPDCSAVGYNGWGWSENPNATGPSWAWNSDVVDSWIAEKSSRALYAMWTPKQVDVTFDCNGGSGGNTQRFTYGVPNQYFAPNCSAYGYELDGWSEERNGPFKYSKDSPVVDSWINNESPAITIYAIWKPKQVAVTFDCNGGVGDNTQTFTYGVPNQYFVQNCSAEGYYVYGWSEVRNGPFYYSPDSIVVDDWINGKSPSVALYAMWSPISYVVSYNGNGATSGWTDSSVHNFNESKQLNYNGYTKAYTIGYNYNGATGNNVRAVDTVAYNFVGWSTYPEGEVQFSNGQWVVNLLNVNGGEYPLYAKWNPDIILLPNPTRDGFIFDGWYADSGLTEFVGYGDEPYVPTTNVTLYAKWRNAAVHQVKIQYHMNGGALDSSHGANISTSGSLITLSGSTIVDTVDYGGNTGSNGLANYNNKNYINIVKDGYQAISGAEWKDSNGRTFSQSTNYNANDFCDASAADCTITLYVNWAAVPTFKVNQTIQDKSSKSNAYIRVRCNTASTSDGVASFSVNGTPLTRVEENNDDKKANTFLAFIKLNSVNGTVNLSCTSQSGKTSTMNLTYTWGASSSHCGTTGTSYSGTCYCYADVQGSSGGSSYSCNSVSYNQGCMSFCQSKGFSHGNGSCSASGGSAKSCWY